MPDQRGGLVSRLERCCSPLLVAHHPLPAQPSLPARLCHALRCPPHGRVAALLTGALAAATVWLASYALLGPGLALPSRQETLAQLSLRSGTVFALQLLVVVGWTAGWLVERVRLPPLLGMLLVGIALKNVPGLEFARGLDPSIATACRQLALAVILLRAGLGLDPAALRSLSAAVFRLAFLPCMYLNLLTVFHVVHLSNSKGLAETVVVAVVARLLLGLPWLWGALLGFTLAAVSPAVVVPCLLSLQQAGFGVEKGIPTLVIAAASLDDVLAISCFTVLLGIAFNPGESVARAALQGPLEAVVGVVTGLCWGGLTVLLPAQPDPSPALRLLLLVGGALLALFGLGRAGLPGSGPLAVLVLAFTAGLGWRAQGWPDSNPVTTTLAAAWQVLQPLLFGLIGSEIRLEALQAGTVGWGGLCLAAGLLVRLLVSQAAVLGSGLSVSERLFVALAWLPKATVQAAIGPLALDQAKRLLAERYPGQACPAVLHSPTAPANSTEQQGLEAVCDMVGHGNTVLTIAVLVILVTAPLGAVAIMTGGPRMLLRQTVKRQVDEEEAT